MIEYIVVAGGKSRKAEIGWSFYGLLGQKGLLFLLEEEDKRERSKPLYFLSFIMRWATHIFIYIH